MSVEQVFRREIDVDNVTPVETGKNDMYEGDAKAHRFELTLKRKGEAVPLTGYTAEGEFVRADGGTVTCPGTVTGNTLSVTLLEACYNVPGDYTLDLKVTKGDVTRTMMSLSGTVRKSGTGVVVDVKDELVNIADIIELYGRMTQATADTTAATKRASDAADAATGAASAANSAAERAEKAAAGYEAGSVANADRLANRSAGFYGMPENLLDNPYWMHEPVNQQGASEYSGAGRAYDRWQGMSRSKMRWDGTTPYMEGMMLSNTAPSAGDAFVQQVIPEERINQAVMTPLSGNMAMTVAFATLLGTFVATGELGSSIEAVNSTSGTNITVKATFLTNAEGKRIFRVSIPQGVSTEQRIYWVGLFPGEVDSEDIPKLMTRTQGEELARCQWFYRRHRAVLTYGTLGTGVARTGTTAWLLINRRRMRTDSPTVTTGGTIYLQHGNGSAIAATAVAVDKVSDDWIRLNVTVASGLSVGMPLVAHSGAASNVWVDEDCDLT